MIEKRGISLLLLLMFSVLMLTACSTQNTPQDDTAYTVHEDTMMGITLKLPEKELNDWTVLYGPFDQSIDRGEFAPEDGSYLSFMPTETGVTLFSIQYYRESIWDNWLSAGHTADEITGASYSEEIGRNGGMVYVYSRPEPDDTNMDDQTKEIYQRVLNMLPTIRESISLGTRGAANTGEFPVFSTTDLSGNAVDSASLSDYQVTMINIWGTFCGPCIEEMPELESMSKSMPEGTRLIGLVTDALDDEHKTLAQNIVSQNGVTYPNWVPDTELQEYIDTHITGVPTMLFINSSGQIVGDAIIGKQSPEKYLSELNSRLSGLSGNEQLISSQNGDADNITQDDSKSNEATNQPQMAGPAPAQ